MMKEQRKEVSRRVRVERGIYMRPGTIPPVYEICWTEGGRLCWRTVKSGLREARAARGDAVARLARGERVARTKLTLAEYANEWVDQLEGQRRPRTVRVYRERLRLHVLPKLGRRKLASIDVDDVADLLADLRRKGLAPWSQRGVLTALGRVLGTAARRGLIAANPCAQLERNERPKITRAEFPSLDREAVGKLIAATPERYRALVAVSVLLGPRQGEALGLRWQDVDTAAGVLRIRRQFAHGELVEPKTNAARREVPMPPSLARMLAEHRLASPYSSETDYVFASSVGTPLEVRNIARRGLDVATRRAGLPRLRWHDLRHVAASAMIEQGASPSYVARVLGHSSPAITLSTYAHVFARLEHEERFRELQEQAFANVLSAAPGKILESSAGKQEQTPGDANTAKPAPLREIGSRSD
jgi:integrase